MDATGYPLKDIPQPHAHDVLCGRGGGTNNHIGNSHWRMLVAANKQLYITLPKRQKMLLSRSIVNAVRSQNPPGRFLQKDAKSSLWFDVGDQRAQEKTSQALREGAPDIRNKLAQQKKVPADAPADTVNSASKPAPADAKEASVSPSPTAATSRQQSKSGSVSANSVGNTSTASTNVHPPAAVSAQVSAASNQGGYSQMNGGHGMPPMAPPAQMQAMAAMQQQQQQQHNNNNTNNNNGNGNMFMDPNMMGQAQQQQGQFMTGGANNAMGMQSTQLNNPQVSGTVVRGAPGTPNAGQMMYYAGPNMAPMPVYPTMILNEQGQMVPAMSVVPPMMTGQMMQQQQQNAGGSAMASNNNNNTTIDPIALNSAESASSVATPKHQSNLSHPHSQNAMQQQQQLQQLYQKSRVSNRTSMNQGQQGQGNNNSNNNNGTYAGAQGGKSDGVMNFEDYIAMLPPDALEPAGLSFGSVTMTDAEQSKLESTGTSFGSIMSYKPINFGGSNANNRQEQVAFFNQQRQQQQQQQQQGGKPQHGDNSNNNNAPAAPGEAGVPQALDGLEPTGISFGDMSMMSVGTNKKLEDTGTSFGSMMSYNTIRADAVDGGLEAIGASFGELSIDTTSKEKLFQSLELAAAGPEVPPMFPETQARSTANLLECSDTESETSQDKQVLQAQKSAAWEKLQEKFALQTTQPETGDEMPPPPGGMPSNGPTFVMTGMPGQLAIPSAANFGRNFSQLSAFSVGNNAAANGQEQYPGESRPADDDEDEIAAVPPPPPPMAKHDDEGEQLERYYLQRGNSLGEEFEGNRASV